MVWGGRRSTYASNMNGEVAETGQLRDAGKCDGLIAVLAHPPTNMHLAVFEQAHHVPEVDGTETGNMVASSLRYFGTS